MVRMAWKVALTLVLGALFMVLLDAMDGTGRPLTGEDPNAAVRLALAAAH